MVRDAVTGMQDLFALHPAYDVILYTRTNFGCFSLFFSGIHLRPAGSSRV